MKFILAILALAFIAPANAKPAKKPDGNAITKRCDPPKRWIEVDALADDAGRPSKLVCK